MVQPSDLEVGVVFIFYDEDIKIPHMKRCVIVGCNEDRDQLAAVYINSEINPADLGSQELEALHYEILPTPERRYINKKSYIDCSDLRPLFPDSLCRNINQQNGAILGKVSEEDLAQIKHRLINGGSILPYYLQLYIII